MLLNTVANVANMTSLVSVSVSNTSCGVLSVRLVPDVLSLILCLFLKGLFLKVFYKLFYTSEEELLICGSALLVD